MPRMKTDSEATQGLKELAVLREVWANERVQTAEEYSRRTVVGGFGTVYPNGHRDVFAWVVSKRKDQRHGVVDRPGPKDPYMEDLYTSMFINW